MGFKQHYLNEGGNIKLPSGEIADKIDLIKLGKGRSDQLKGDLLNMFKELNIFFERKYGRPFWKNYIDLNSRSNIYSGSTRSFFQQPHEELVKYKSVIGDIDIQVPDELLSKLEEFLGDNIGTKFHGWKWKGFTKSSTQLNGLVEAPAQWHDVIKHIQIDFEGTPYDNDYPSEFANFGHYSSWEDMKVGVKGLFSKLLIRALVSTLKEEDMVIIGKRGKPLKRDLNQSHYSFSVDHGLRGRLEPVMDGDTITITNGLPTYKELPTKIEDYERNISKIYSMIFGHFPNETQKKSLYSFISLLQMMKIRLDTTRVERVLDKLMDLMWGNGVRGIERYDPSTDKELKLNAYNEVLSMFPFYRSKQKQVGELIDTYYKNYDM